MPHPAWICHLCGEPMEHHHDRRGNPYLECFGCGVQTFIRRKSAIAVYEQKFGTGYKAAPITPAPPASPAPPKEPAHAAPPAPAPAPAPRKRKLLDFDD